MSLAAFDVLLAAALLWSAWRALTVAHATRAVVMFIVFGLFMALAWARLDAPDIALAEAAIGAGLTGALLLDWLGARGGRDAAVPARGRWLSTLLAVAAAGGLGALLLDLPDAAVRLPDAVTQQMPHSGVSHPVTAVLLNFRGYDTLLEVAVLLAALFGLLALAGERAPGDARDGQGRLPHTGPALRPTAGAASPAGCEGGMPCIPNSPLAPQAGEGDEGSLRDVHTKQEDTAPGPLLQTLARLAAPLMVVVAGYLLWAGAHQPGGAFQAAAVLAAAGVLLHLAGLMPAWAQPARLLRFGLSGGLLVFVVVALLPLAAAPLLTYPLAWAGALILLVESALTISLGLVLAGLFLFLTARGKR